MSYRKTFTCDICGAIKGETNHWFQSRKTQFGWFFQSWNEADTKNGVYLDLCGDACVVAQMGRYLADSKEGKNA